MVSGVSRWRPRGPSRIAKRKNFLAILDLYVALMLPIKFWLNPTYSLGGDVVWRISPLWPSWISEWNNFSNYEFLYCSDASHQVLAQSDLRFGKRCLLKNWQRPSWTSEQNHLSNSESLCHFNEMSKL